MKLVGMRQRVPVHPRLFIETDRIDDQRIPLPVADRMAVVARYEIFSGRMGPPVEINGLKVVGPAVVENIDALLLRHFQDLETIRGRPLPRTRRRLTARIRLVLQEVTMAVIDESS